MVRLKSAFRGFNKIKKNRKLRKWNKRLKGYEGTEITLNSFLLLALLVLPWKMEKDTSKEAEKVLYFFWFGMFGLVSFHTAMVTCIMKEKFTSKPLLIVRGFLMAFQLAAIAFLMVIRINNQIAIEILILSMMFLKLFSYPLWLSGTIGLSKLTFSIIRVANLPPIEGSASESTKNFFIWMIFFLIQADTIFGLIFGYLRARIQKKIDFISDQKPEYMEKEEAPRSLETEGQCLDSHKIKIEQVFNGNPSVNIAQQNNLQLNQFASQGKPLMVSKEVETDVNMTNRWQPIAEAGRIGSHSFINSSSYIKRKKQILLNPRHLSRKLSLTKQKWVEKLPFQTQNRYKAHRKARTPTKPYPFKSLI